MRNRSPHRWWDRSMLALNRPLKYLVQFKVVDLIIFAEVHLHRSLGTVNERVILGVQVNLHQIHEAQRMAESVLITHLFDAASKLIRRYFYQPHFGDLAAATRMAAFRIGSPNKSQFAAG